MVERGLKPATTYLTVTLSLVCSGGLQPAFHHVSTAPQLGLTTELLPQFLDGSRPSREFHKFLTISVLVHAFAAVRHTDDVVQRGRALVRRFAQDHSEFRNGSCEPVICTRGIERRAAIGQRDIEARVPKLDTPLALYCGGGFRSALAADNLQKMGYTNVISMDGGIRDWREKGYPLSKG